MMHGCTVCTAARYSARLEQKCCYKTELARVCIDGSGGLDGIVQKCTVQYVSYSKCAVSNKRW